MRHWFEHFLESTHSFAHQLCGEQFADGLALAIIWVKTRVCPITDYEDEGTQDESLDRVIVTTVRQPPEFSYDITEKAEEIFADEGMLTQDEAIGLAEGSFPTASNLLEHNDEEEGGTIVQLTFISPDTHPHHRYEILRESGDVAVWMKPIQHHKQN